MLVNVLPKIQILKLKDLSLQVRLGCLADERANRQEVRVSVDFRFLSAPEGITTDDLNDTICYAQVSEALKTVLESGEYALIEKMAFDAYRVTKEITKNKNAEILVTIHKVRPPVDNMLGGTFYQCGDFV